MNRELIKAKAREYIRTGVTSPLVAGAIVIMIVSLLNSIPVAPEYENAMMAEMERMMTQGAAYVPQELPAMPPMATFFTVLVMLVTTVLHAGFYSYCMGIRRNEQMPLSALADGLGIAGKVIWCDILVSVRIMLWSMLFVLPGVVAFYRYRFAMYNIVRDPSLSVAQAIALSCRQTAGIRMELFVLDLTFLGWRVASVLTLGILNVYVLPYTTLTDLGYYEDALHRLSAGGEQETTREE